MIWASKIKKIIEEAFLVEDCRHRSLSLSTIRSLNYIKKCYTDQRLYFWKSTALKSDCKESDMMEVLEVLDHPLLID